MADMTNEIKPLRASMSLHAAVDAARARGHEYVQIVVERQNRPRSNRVVLRRGRPTLYAKIIGPTGRWPGQFLAEFKVSDAEAYMAGFK